MRLVIRAFVYLLYAAVPVILVTGIVRGLRERPVWNAFTRATRIGFVLGMISAYLAFASWICLALPIGFSYNDPLLRRAYSLGVLLSALGTGTALLGLGRSSTLRWHALMLSLSMLVLWFVWATGE